MISAVIELILFSLPSLFYMRTLRRRNCTRTEARTAVGWPPGNPSTYVLAIGVTIVLLPLTYLALRAIPTGSVPTAGRLHVTYGRASSVGGYVSIALLAVAEEVL